ncbi:DUF7168 domain-containing protein [Roseospira goensis]|uniref:DUF7168 domain-containing protein n=1 Tax=Roseospira goensis TaxID=391922 RepID=A0A7W6S2J4_9PROT|nr:hypothetical protein [Roseospira goensis]MBB4287721.1 hypothetical protein [Roseospira goensis]
MSRRRRPRPGRHLPPHDAAAATAARLMSAHGLEPDDLVMGSETVEGTVRATALDALWGTLAAVTGCCCIHRTTWDGAARIYHGRMPGPTIAVYLHVYLRRTVEAAVEEYRRTPEYRRKKNGKPRRRACEAFRHGMVARLQVALVRHFGRPDQAALDAAQASAEKAMGPMGNAAPPPAYRGRNDTAVRAGMRAGAGVALRDGLSGGTTGLIEGPGS